MLIGNDLVDLRTREARGKAGDARFIERVFCEREVALIRRSPAPDLTVWTLWAGKEAAFKIARKLCPGLPFAHRCYQADPEAGRVKVVGVRGLEGISFRAEWHQDEELVHCVATSAGSTESRFWSRVARRGEADESSAVRRLARALAGEAGLGEVEVVRERSEGSLGPPRLFRAGEPLAGWDLSLSHDGVWVAAALCGMPNEPRS